MQKGTLFPLLLLFFTAFISAHLDHPEEPGHVVRGSSNHARVLHDFEIITVNSPPKHEFKTQRRSMEEKENREQPFPDELHFEFEAYNTTFWFDLKINQNLMHPKIKIEVYGKKRSWEENIPHRFYKGTAKSSFGEGWARLTLYESPQGDHLIATGAFVQNDVVYQLFIPEEFQKLKTHVVSKRHERKRASDPDVSFVLYRESDVEVLDPHAETCGTFDMQFNNIVDDGHRHLTNPLAEFDLHKRADSGCPTTDKQLYLGVMSDCNFTPLYTDVTSEILSNFNQVSALYESTYNVMLGIIHIQIKTECGTTPADPNGGNLNWNQDCSNANYEISDRLSDFAEWRGVQSSDAGLWHLYSNCPTGTTIGIAWLNMLCQTSSFSQTSSGVTQYVSGVAVATQVDNTWIVSAHEIGHNFGAIHDCTSSCTGSTDTSCCVCPPTCDCQAQYIMNPSNAIATNTFSPCTQTQICSRYAITGTCLEDPGTETILNQNVCGNGIWEPPAEQCDCGGVDGCKNNTCCRVNCTLYPDAECNDGNSACCKDCQIIRSPEALNITCRNASGQCDLPEFCTGANASCPADTYKTDGTACTTIADAYCASGVCTNRAQQCINTALLYDKPEYTQDCLGSCQIFCQASFEGCRYFPGTFLNGTKCGSNNQGVCQGGICSTGDIISSLIDWITSNLVMVIATAILVSIVVLGFLFWGCRKANRKDLQLGKTLSRMSIRRRPPPSSDIPSTPPPQRGPRNSRAGQAQRPPSTAGQSRQSGQRASTSGAPPPRDQLPPASPAPIVEHPPEYSEIALQVRCPICSKTFRSEAELDHHLDVEHS